MLNRLDLLLEDAPLHPNMGSIFQGYLMEQIDTDYVDYLHHLDLNPYSTFLFYDREKRCHVWRINTLNPLATQMIIDVMEQKQIKSIYLDQKNKEYAVKAIHRHPSSSYEELFLDQKKCQTIHFLTPTSFKSNNVYQIFPKEEWLFHGVIRKLNQFSTQFKMEETTAIQEMLDKTRIQAYQLKSTRYGIEKVNINGFQGWIRVKCYANEEYQSLYNFLLKLMPYTGLGIKTSLGMGGVHVE